MNLSTQNPAPANDGLAVAPASRRSWIPVAVWLGYAIFFASGFAALVYEISWSRQIGLLFGHTVQAAAIVLAAYFCGLAAGYLLGASRWASSRSPLYSYGVAEIVAAVWALALPSLLMLGQDQPFSVWLNHPSASIQILARSVFSFTLLLPATTALGFTLPQMANWLAAVSAARREGSQAGARISRAYALNTAGALCGVLAASFVLLVHVGVRQSSFFAAGISLACGIAAAVLHQFSGWRATDKSLPKTASSAVWTFVAAVSGFAILALEVLYTHLFSLVFHNSTYTFGTVVAVFLGSLALGAAFASCVQQRLNLRSTIGWCSATGSVAVIVSVILFLRLTELRYFAAGDSFLGYLTGALALVAVVVGPPMTLLGMLLPITWQAASAASVSEPLGKLERRSRSGSFSSLFFGSAGNRGRVMGLPERVSAGGDTVGRLTAVDSLAAAFGALAAGLALPLIGLWQFFVLLSAVLLSVAVGLLWKNTAKAVLAAPVLVMIGGSVLMAKIGNDYDQGTFRRGDRLVQRWHSSYGWIDLIHNEQSNSYKVRQNLHYRFGETGATAREYRQAHLPLLLHPDPADVLFLGMGTGLTAGGAVPHKRVRRIDVVELIPEVVEAAGLLAEQNFDLVNSPKVNVHVNDGRHFMLATTRRFDVIISDLFVPWESETGYLYTVEHYKLARDRLKPGGLFSQCLPLYQLGTREFELIADSFAAVFPHVTIWWLQMDAARPVIALVGAEAPLDLDAADIDRRLGTLWSTGATADPVIRDADRLWSLYAGDWPRRVGATLNTDEHPRVEFFTPVSNRDGEMISGVQLLSYFENVLSDLPIGSAAINVDAETRADRSPRSSHHRFLLFGQ